MSEEHELITIPGVPAPKISDSDSPADYDDTPVITVHVEVWNRWAPDALESPLAPAELVRAYNRWQPDHLKIRTTR